MQQADPAEFHEELYRWNKVQCLQGAWVLKKRAVNALTGLRDYESSAVDGWLANLGEEIAELCEEACLLEESHEYLRSMLRAGFDNGFLCGSDLDRLEYVFSRINAAEKLVTICGAIIGRFGVRPGYTTVATGVMPALGVIRKFARSAS